MGKSFEFVQTLEYQEEVEGMLITDTFSLDRERGQAQMRRRSEWANKGGCLTVWEGPIDELLAAVRSAPIKGGAGDLRELNLSNCTTRLFDGKGNELPPIVESSTLILPFGMLHQMARKIHLTKKGI